MAEIYRRLALSEDAEAKASDDRTIRFVFSTSNVALDGHRILPGAWQSSGHDGLSSFRDNPVFLWAHKDDEPPVGKVVEIAEKDGKLIGAVRFADHPQADTVFRLYKDGFMRGASVSWQPVEFRYATGQNRAPGAIDFQKVNLIEISAVPLPADQSALSVARSLGLAVAAGARMSPSAKESECKCGASRSLPIDEDSEWDGAEAEKSIFDKAGFDGDEPDLNFARKGFLAYDAANPKERGSYKLPFAKVVDGRLTAVASGLRAAASRLPQVDLRETVREKGRAVIDDYEGKMTKSADRAAKPVVTKRGLYEIASLAYAMANLGWIKEVVDWEEAAEGDEASANPANVAAALQALGKALVEMTQEEVAEALAGIEASDLVETVRAFRRAANPGVSVRALLNKKDRTALEDVGARAERHRALCATHAEMARAIEKDGSDADARERCARHAEVVTDHAEGLNRCLRDYIDDRTPDDAEDDDQDSGDNDGGDDGDAVIGRRHNAEQLREQEAKRRAREMIYGK